MAKKRAAKVTELHFAPRKLNPDIKRRVVVMLHGTLVLKLKTIAFESHKSVQQLVSEMIESQLK